MILKERIVFNDKFLKVFTEDELQDIVDSAVSFSTDCIVISTDDNFFELSADRG